MSETIESRGRTVEEAVAEALLQLGARKDEVDVTVVEEGRSGFLGFLGARQAVVRVTRKTILRTGRRDGRGGRSRSDRSRGDAATDGGGARKQEAAAETEGRSRGRRRGRRRKDGTAAESGDRAGGRAAGGLGSDGRGADERRGNDRSPAPSRERPAAHAERPAGPDGNVKAEPVGDEIRAAERARVLRGLAAAEAPANLREMTTELMRLGGFPCRVEIVEGDYHLIKLVTDDSSAGVLIGRHGATVDALEHLVERMISQATGERVNMNLDVNNYRRRREEMLAERARDIMRKVLETGREIHMEPLCARERRIVHMEITGEPRLRTYTLVSQNGKHVVVALAGQEGPQGAVTGADDWDDDAPGEDAEDPTS
jgi:spoIIIJ-associated protein